MHSLWFDRQREVACYMMTQYLTLKPLQIGGLSQKFWSAKNFGPGPIFSGKIGPGQTNFFEIGPVLTTQRFA